MTFIKQFNLFQWILIGIVSIISFYFMITGIGEGDILFLILDFIAAICGMFSVVLCANGKRSGFIFGLINVIGYSIISFSNMYYGEVMLNTLFYIPMNIISFILWKRNQNRETHVANAKSLTLKQLTISLIIIVIITYGYHELLTFMGGAMTILDGTTTILSIFATILMAARYAEQWLFWIIIDIITTILWVIAGDPIMIAMWGAYTINAIYGYVAWLIRSGREIRFIPNSIRQVLA